MIFQRDCYGGTIPQSGCCNTCDEVEQSYIDKGWTLKIHSEVEQCVREGHDIQLNEQRLEGCNIHGFVEVNKVAGNFHFAPGKGFQQGNMHMHELSSFGKMNMFFDHQIHELSFGDTINFKNPLDGLRKYGLSSNMILYT